MLTEAGFKRPIPIVTLESTPEAIKALIKSHADDGLFLVGGAMGSTYADLMADLDKYIADEVPTMRVHNVSKADFPPDCPMPPTEEIISQAAVTVCNALLAKA